MADLNRILEAARRGRRYPQPAPQVVAAGALVPVGADGVGARLDLVEAELQCLVAAIKNRGIPDLPPRVAELESSRNELAEAWTGRMAQLEQLAARMQVLEAENTALKVEITVLNDQLGEHLAEHRGPRGRMEADLELTALETEYCARVEQIITKLAPEDQEDVRERALRRFREPNGRPSVLPAPHRGQR